MDAHCLESMNLFTSELACYYSSPCNRFALSHLFVGTCCALLGRHSGYLAVFWTAIFLQLHFAVGTNVTLLQAGVNALAGLLLGTLLRIVLDWRVCLLTEHTLHRHRNILVVNLQYLLGTAVFIPANLAVKENGVAYGMWLTVIAFWFWLCLVYFSTQKKIQRQARGLSEYVHFNRSFVCLGLGIAVVLLIACIPVFNDYVAVGMGLFAAPLICWLRLRDAVAYSKSVKTG